MAQRVIKELVDDLDGSEADETVTFGLDGAGYAIDLSYDNAERMRDALQVYVDAARPAQGGRRAASPGAKRRKATATVPRPASDPARLYAIRQWARKNGHKVADRGRIPAHVVEAFDAAHAA